MRILKMREVAAKVARAESWVYAKVAEGKFPRPIGLQGGQTLGWVEAEIDEWLQALVARRDELAAASPNPYAILGERQTELRARRLARLEAARQVKREAAAAAPPKRRGRPRLSLEERAKRAASTKDRAAAAKAKVERAAEREKHRSRARRAAAEQPTQA